VTRIRDSLGTWHPDLSAVEQAFTVYLADEQGLAQVTVSDLVPRVHRFVRWKAGSGSFVPQKLRAADVTRYISERAAQVRPSTMRGEALALRHFFRFLRLRGDVTIDLVPVIPKIAGWKLAWLPKFISAAEVRQILRTCDRSTATGQRDYAMLILLARLGLRAGEVAAMTLDDIAWDAGEILVRGKGLRRDRLPLPHDVGAALARYLKEVRPRSLSRHVFLTTKGPLRGIAPAGVSGTVKRAILRSGIKTPSCGAHLLRHSLATDLLRRGAPMEEIAELLRHRHLETTAIYAKVDLVALRALAQPWPGARA